MSHVAGSYNPLTNPDDPAYRPPLAADAAFPPAGEVGHPNLKELLCRNLGAEALIADIGCGGGPFDYDRWRAAFVAFDVRPPVSSAGMKPVDEFRLGRLQTFPLDDASCDAVLMGFILEHVTDPREFLREADRVLEPGGWCYVAVPNHRSLEDRMLRLATRVAGSSLGPHIQRFTFDNFVELASSCTSLRLVAWHRLDASFLWMMHPRLKRLRPVVVRALMLLRRCGLDLLKEGNYQFLFRSTK